MDISHLKVPTKGENVLVFDECLSDAPYESYRKACLANGGRIRHATSIKALQLHLGLTTKFTFIVHIPRDFL